MRIFVGGRLCHQELPQHGNVFLLNMQCLHFKKQLLFLEQSYLQRKIEQNSHLSLYRGIVSPINISHCGIL